MGSGAAAGETLDQLFRRQYGQMVAALTRIFGSAHLDLAHEVVQDAMVRALQHWPYHGVPENPSGWLFRAARNRALDLIRRDRSFAGLQQELVRVLPAEDDTAPRAFGDDQICLLFLCCHPELSPEARVALTLKSVCGFSVAEIARAFFADEAAIAQRLVRAKRTIRERELRFEMPPSSAVAARLDSVLSVIYLVFNEGYAATAGDRMVREELCDEAVWLASELTAHDATSMPETHALLALMLLHASRLPARTDAAGDPALLEDQDRSLWDRRLIAAGLTCFARACEGERMSRYHLEAAIAAAHARAASAADTDWRHIADIYEELLTLTQSPVVALNRAVALARACGPAAGLAAMEDLAAVPVLKRWHLYHSVAGWLWAAAGDRAKAASAYRLALSCPCNEPERRFIARKLEEVSGGADEDGPHPRSGA